MSAYSTARVHQSEQAAPRQRVCPRTVTTLRSVGCEASSDQNEGFGNLDSDTLDVVVDALERLREGDRMVGVISHVETLAQCIPTGLTVQPNGGSTRIVAR